jgi:molybdopterin synthase sulfur carrier subunit
MNALPKVKFYGALRKYTKARQLEIDGDNVGIVLQRVCKDNPGLKKALFDDEGKLHPYVRIMVNGRAIELAQGLETPLTSEQEVALFPPIAGG